MSRRSALAAVAALALLPACAPSAPPTEAQLILSAAMAGILHSPMNPGRASCVRLRPERSGLAYSREAAAMHRTQSAAGPAVASPAEGLSDWYRQQRPDAPSAPVAPAEEERLVRASAALLARPPATPPEVSLAGIDLPRPLVRYSSLRRLVGGCPKILELTAPAMVGSLAFVDVDLRCSGFCGGGVVVALERRPGGWTVVGTLVTWVS